MAHPLSVRRAMPVFRTRSRMDGIASANAGGRAALLLIPATTLRHVEDLSGGMRVPIGSCAGLEGHQCGVCLPRSDCRSRPTNGHCTGKCRRSRRESTDGKRSDVAASGRP